MKELQPTAAPGRGWMPVLATIPQSSAVYITIDAEGLDPTEMPAVMAPSPGGILYREIAPVLRRIARAHRVVGASWAPDGAMRRRSRGGALSRTL